MSRRHRVAQPAGGLHAENPRMQELRPAHGLLPCQRKERARERRRDVDDGAQVGVVVVLRRRGRGVDQRIVIGKRAAQDPHRRVGAAGEHAARDVQDRALRLVARRGGDVFPARRREEPRELAGQSSFTPACFTTGAHLALSACMKAPKASAVPGIGSAPCPMRRSRTSGD